MVTLSASERDFYDSLHQYVVTFVKICFCVVIVLTYCNFDSISD